MVPVSFGRQLLFVLGVCLFVNQIYRIPFSTTAPIHFSTQSLAECEPTVRNQSEPEIADNRNHSVSSASPTDAPTFKENDDHSIVRRPSGCQEIMIRMQEWSNCWRHHLELLSTRQPFNDTQVLSMEPVLCPISTGDGSIQMEAVGAPLYQWAFYQGQGFGRVLAHTVEACITTFLLGRPCFVNMSPRDPYYTFRSFIHENTYHWDPSVLHSAPGYADQIEALAKALPKMGANQWDQEAFHASKFDNDWSLVFPMKQTFAKEKWMNIIQYYHANNTNSIRRPHQVLFSPNWGMAWFTKLQHKLILPEYYQCKLDILKSELQQAMYGPTDLSQQLHDRRYHAAATSGKWNFTKNPTPPQEKTDEIKVLRKTTSSKSNPLNEEYGAIHLRMHFINEVRPEPIAKGELVTIVRRCLAQASKEIGKEKFPKNWWLLSDNSTMAVYAAEGMENRQRTQLAQGENTTNALFHKSIPIVNLYHNYKITNETKKNLKELSSQHSNSETIRGKYGHNELSGAIEDWMALYSSKIAIVVSNGSFGTTGARGNGKVPRALCGGENGPSDPKNRYFEIYF